MTPWSVRASAGISSSAALATIPWMRLAPSSSENSVWLWGWNELSGAGGIVVTGRRAHGVDAPPERVVCGVGGTGVICTAVAALVEADDEVLVPDPGWSNYRLMLAMLHARAVLYPCPQPLGFLPDLERLEALIT